MNTALTIIIVLLIVHIIQNDARLRQVVKELGKLQKSMEEKNCNEHR